MKYLVILTCLFFFFSFGLANSQGLITADISGDVWDDEGTIRIHDGPQTVVIALDLDNTAGGIQYGWSTPFNFSGNITLTGAGSYEASPILCPIWSMCEWWEDPVNPWDGDLSNGELVCNSGNSMDGIGQFIIPDVFTFTFNTDGAEDQTFCIENGGTTANGGTNVVSNLTYDWLFDPPGIIFDGACWTVKYQPPEYLCGDVNSDGNINILDLTFYMSWLYKSGPAPYYRKSADADYNCSTNILDITYLIFSIYKDGPVPQCPPDWPCN